MVIQEKGADGTTPLLILQPFAFVPFEDDPDVQSFLDQVRRLGCGFTYATIKPELVISHASAPVVDNVFLRHHQERIFRLLNGTKPTTICTIGQNLTRTLSTSMQMETSASKRILNYPTKFRVGSGRELPGLGLAPIQMLMSKYQERALLDEQLAKLKTMIDGKRYEREGKVVVLEDHDKIKRFLMHLQTKHKGFVAFDTETRNLNFTNNTTLCTMQFAMDDETGYVIYWDHEYNKRDRERDKLELRPLFERLFASKDTSIQGWIMHNAQFDLQQVRAEFKLEFAKPVLDTMLMLHMMDQGRGDAERMAAFYEKPYSLKQAVLEFLGYHGYDSETLAARKNGVVADLPKDKLDRYAGQDGFITYRLFLLIVAWARFIGYDKKLMKFSYVVSSGALKTFATMSQSGMNLDREHLAMMKLPTSRIQQGLREINDKLRNDPMVQKINEELVQKKTNTKYFWGPTPYMFNLGKSLHRTALFYDSPHGRQYPLMVNVKTKKEEKTCAKAFLAKYKATDPLVKTLAEFSEMQKLNNAYVTSMSANYDNARLLKTDYTDGKAHCRYQLSGTQTGRIACFAAGTKIEVVRDLSKQPEGTPIENVNVGDLVYCLNRLGKPALGRVSWSGQTGVREVVRLTWRSKSGRLGSVLLTPEHRVRTASRGWVEAQYLKPSEVVLALSRSRDQLYFTGIRKTYADHRFVWQNSGATVRKAPPGYVVHHKDHEHLNNTPTNLELVTQSAHGQHHGETLVYSRYGYIRLLARAAGRPVRVDHDFESLLRHGKDVGVDWQDIKFRYGADNRYLSKQRIVAAFETYGSTTNKALFDELRVGSRRLKALCEFYGIAYGVRSKKTTRASVQYRSKRVLARTGDGNIVNNHRVVSVEATGLTLPVYDLTVEKHHCFYANEILSHNCVNPNLQQIPRAEGPLKTEVKNIFTVDKQGAILQADFAAAEVRMWGSLSHDKFLIELLKSSYDMRAQYRANPTDDALRARAELMADIHKQTAALMFGVAIADVTKPLRSVTKSIVFGLIYGRGIPSIAEQLGKTVEETEALCEQFFKQFPQGVAWLDEMKRFCEQYGYVETPFGRRRQLAFVHDQDRGRREAALRRSINTPVQSTTGDFATLSISLLHHELKRLKMTKHFWLVNAVHDSTLIRIPKSADALAEVTPLVRDCFTVKSRDILLDHFGFELEAPMDIDVEVSQDRSWKCVDCGNVYKAYKDHCDGTKKGDDGKDLKDENDKPIKCKSERRTEVRLNGGWGTLIGIDETEHGYAAAALGFMTSAA